MPKWRYQWRHLDYEISVKHKTCTIISVQYDDLISRDHL
ncbi:hypothetical protein A4U88_2398 [Serratia marcescens]|nr:hypothetical protein A4U88_2398 [Serratia marcescens]